MIVPDYTYELAMPARSATLYHLFAYLLVVLFLPTINNQVAVNHLIYPQERSGSPHQLILFNT